MARAERASYGFDAPYVPIFLCGWGSLLIGAGVVVALTIGPWVALGAARDRRVHPVERDQLRVHDPAREVRWSGPRWWPLLPWSGTETVIDLGCGRGAVLVRAAQRVPHGRALGVDIWRRVDQTGNNADATRRNLADRRRDQPGALVHRRHARVAAPEQRADVVVSSLAIHNIPDAAGRRLAIEEAYRALRPGGRLLVADFRATSEYVDTLRTLGATDVSSRDLGWRFWYGGPWAANPPRDGNKPEPA